MDTKLQKIINLYKKDLQKFIEKNALNTDYYADIEERIDEKITLLENPTRDDIKNILSEIGSPEEIFREELESRVIEKVTIKKKWYQKFLASDRVIFLGVFKDLSHAVFAYIGAWFCNEYRCIYCDSVYSVYSWIFDFENRDFPLSFFSRNFILFACFPWAL